MATSIVYTSDQYGVALDFNDGTNIITHKIDGVESSPTLNVTTLEIPRTDGAKMISSRYTPRTITVTGKILPRATTTLMRTAVDNLLKYQTSTGTLDVTFDGWSAARRYFVQATNVVITNAPYQITWVPFSITFVAYDPPFGEDITSTAISTSSGITGTTTSTFTQLGTANGNVTIQLSAMPAGFSGTVELLNQNTGDSVTITRTWQTTDILTVNSANRNVSVNGVNVAYSGNVLAFPPGSNKVRVSCFVAGGLLASCTTYNAEVPLQTSIATGQTFTVSSSVSVARIDALLYRIGTIAGNISYSLISGFGGGSPTTLVSGTIGATTGILTAPSWVPIIFSAQTLASGVTYALLLTAPFTPTPDNEIMWKYSTTDVYAGGSAYDDINSLTSGDRGFRVWSNAAVSGLSATMAISSKSRWL